MRREMDIVLKVGFLLFYEETEETFFVVRELHDKPEINKEIGMLSIPLITMTRQDLSFQTAIWRLLRKEVGITDSRQVEILGVFNEVFTPIRGRPNCKIVYGYGLLMDRSFRQFDPEDPGIETVGWMTPLELLKREEKIRMEVPLIVTHFNTKQCFQSFDCF